MKRILFRYDDGSNAAAEINQNKASGFNYNWMDFRYLNKRFVPSSTSMKFPPSSSNKQVFGYFEQTGINLGFARQDTIGVEMYFDAIRILKGRFNLRNYDKGYNGFITGGSDVINAINEESISDILDNSTITASFTSLTNAISYFNDSSTDGWLIPLDYAGDKNNTEDSYASHYVEWEEHLFGQCYNTIWRSVSKFLDDLISDTGISIYVQEASGLVSFASSNLYTLSRYHYFPVFRYCVDRYGTSVYVRKGDTTKKAFNSYYQTKPPVLTLAEFADFPVNSTFDFIKIYSQLFNCGLYIDDDNDRIILINYQDYYGTISSNLDWSEKYVSSKKRASISNYEKLNYVNFNNLGSSAKENTRATITNLDAYWLKTDKDLYALNLIAPSFDEIDGINTGLVNIDYFTYGDFASKPCILERASSTTSCNVKLGPLLSTGEALYKMEFDNVSSQYGWVDDMLAIGEEYDAEFNLNLYDITLIKPWSQVFVKGLGGIFHVNKINSFDPYNNKKAKVNIVKIG